MSKELTPLEALEKLYGFYDLPYRNEIAYMLEQENLDKYKEIIEKALKDIDYLKTLNENQKHNIKMLIEENREMKKSLKALKIIKEKEVNVQDFKSCLEVGGWDYELCEKDCQDNNPWEESPPYRHSMTKEEFELLKEILK